MNNKSGQNYAANMSNGKMERPMKFSGLTFY